MRQITKLHGLLVNWKAIVACCVLMLVSLAMLWASEKLSVISPIVMGKVVPSFAAVIATSGVFALMYEVFVRRQQINFMLESLELRESLIRAGLDNVSLNYLDYDYAKAILTSKDIKVFFLYAQTWLHRYEVELAHYLEQEGRGLTVCVPALDNPFLPALAEHFTYTLDDLKRRIAESVAICSIPALKGRIGSGTRLRIHMHRARASYSMYKFDDTVLVGMYYASSARRRAPTFEFIDAPGSVYSDFVADLEEVIEEESTLIFDSETGKNELLVALDGFLPQSLSRILSPVPPAGKPSS